jgi:hypothetical protein
MGLHYHRRISLFPGVRLNASKPGLSLSVGIAAFGSRSGRGDGG